MANHERKCVICGKEYRYCPRCSEYKNMERWHINYCSEKCRDIFNVLNPYAFKHIDLETAKEKLEKIGVNKDTVLFGEYNGILDEIYGRNKKPERNEPKKVEFKKKEKEIVKED